MKHRKIAVISGGGGSLGLSIAKYLTESGIKPVLIGRRKGNHGEFDFYQCDITNYDETERTINQIVDKYKKLDIAIHGAASKIRRNSEKILRLVCLVDLIFSLPR